MTKIHEAVTLLTNGQYDTEELLETLELAFHTFAFDYINLDGDSIVGKKDAGRILFSLETLMDGLKGKFLKE